MRGKYSFGLLIAACAAGRPRMSAGVLLTAGLASGFAISWSLAGLALALKTDVVFLG